MGIPRVAGAVAASDLVGTPSDIHCVIEFSEAMQADVVLSDRLSYSVDGGINVEGVSVLDASHVLLLTTRQVSGRQYRVYVSQSLRSAATSEFLDLSFDSALFSGAAGAASYIVRNLEARPWPGGGRIDLFWDDPVLSPGDPPVNTVIILRRLRSWIYDGSDEATLVYVGPNPVFTSGEPRYKDSAGLIEGEFYYYAVGVTSLATVDPEDFEFTDSSRVFALCSANLGSVQWITQRGMIPETQITEGGKPPYNGFFSSFYLKVYGAWLDLMRSHMNSITAFVDDERAPFSIQRERNQDMGFDPEGSRYDYDTLRRTILDLPSLRKTKGRGSSLVQAAWTLVRWEVEVEEFGLQSRPRCIGFWDGESVQDSGIASSVTFGELNDITKAWGVGLWDNSRLLDGLGNWIRVQSSTATKLVLETGPWVLLTADSLAGSGSFTAASVAGLLPGQRVILHDPVTGVAEVVEVTNIDPMTGTCAFWNTTQNSYLLANGARYSVNVCAPQAEMSGTGSGGVVDEFTPTVSFGSAHWIDGQWTGLLFEDSVGNVRTIIGNSATKLFFNDGLVSPNGIFLLYRSATAGVPDFRYLVFNGENRRFPDTLWDAELRGTRYDPFCYFYAGYEGVLRGGFGPCDIGLYVKTPGVAVVGRVVSYSGSTIMDTSANFVPGGLIGQYLNPNQNQERLFKIIDNSATTITVGTNIEHLARLHQGYAVLTERNATRYSRLCGRIREFCPKGRTIHVLFV